MRLPDIPTLNVIQLGFGFFTNFFAFNSQGFIEEAVIDSASDNGKIDKHAGYLSLAIIYAVFTFANFVAAPIVDILSPKWAMFLGALCYAFFQVGFLFLNETFLYISSAVIGFGAAIIWTGQGSYLSQNCTKETASRNSALLWGMSESSLLAGGLFLFIIFTTTGSTNDEISTSTINILYSVFFILSLISALIFALLRAPSYPEVKDKENYGKLIASTFDLMFTKKMFILAFVFAYTGLCQSFWTGIYPTCVSFTKQLGSNTNALLALNAICTGFGQTAAGVFIGFISDRMHKIGRDSIVLLGTLIHLVVFILCYINFPADAPLKQTNDSGLIQPSIVIALIAGGLLGFGDACWNTQLYSFLVDSYPDQSAQAFALYKFYQSALSCAAFFYSPVLQLQWHLVILVITSLLAAAGFFIVERFSRNAVHDFQDAQKVQYNMREGENNNPSMSPIKEADPEMLY